jgi:hypothetical protein
MNLVGDLIYLVAAMMQVTPQQHNQQICGKLTGLFHPHQVLLLYVTDISLCVAGLCGTATHGPCVLITASLTAFRIAVSILG